MVFLQTSCSKEQSDNSLSGSARKSAPVAIDLSHDDVLDFKEQFDLFTNDEPTDYPTLSVEDAELILEAALNYDHVIEGPIEPTTIAYEAMDPFTVSTGEYEGAATVSSEILFTTYQQLLTLCVNVSDMAPLSDLEILPVDDGGGFKIHPKFSRLEIEAPWTGPERIAYEEYQHASVAAPQGPIPNGCPGPTLNKAAYEALHHNIRLTTDPWLQLNGYGVYVEQRTFGDNPFDANAYIGRSPFYHDYSLSMWGVHPSVNPLSTANGDPEQCITKAEMQHYESEVVNVMIPTEMRFPTSRVWNFNYSTKQSHDYNNFIYNWEHHKITFTTGSWRVL